MTTPHIYPRHLWPFAVGVAAKERSALAGALLQVDEAALDLGPHGVNKPWSEKWKLFNPL